LPQAPATTSAAAPAIVTTPSATAAHEPNPPAKEPDPPAAVEPAPVSEWLSAADRCAGDVWWTRLPSRACLTGDGAQIWTASVEFKPDKDVITAESFPALDAVVALLNAYPQIARIEIEGHLGEPEVQQYGRSLSKARADSVRKYLISRGIAAERLLARGYGVEKPIDNTRTKAGRLLNRRIELKVLARR
jgi:outer membrane protein OmpA-like peptidoglycan-associated protein